MFGGSVRTQDASGRTYITDNPGGEHITENLAQIPVVSLGLGTIDPAPPFAGRRHHQIHRTTPIR